MRLFLFTILFLLNLLKVDAYNCYACNVNGAPNSCNNPVRTQCALSQSCLTIVNTDNSVSKGCAFDTNGNPRSMRTGCYTDNLGQYVCACNFDYCNGGNPSNNAGSSIEPTMIILSIFAVLFACFYNKF